MIIDKKTNKKVYYSSNPVTTIKDVKRIIANYYGRRTNVLTRSNTTSKTNRKQTN